MGTKIEGENYMPGYYATGDLNMEPNGRWSPYYEDRISNGQLCNGFTTKPTNGYSEFDKEMLKHQMLEHEAVFRQQVYELHRVYKIQRGMMRQHQSKEIYSYPLLAVASHTNSPSQVPPNGANMLWQMPAPPVSTTYRKASVAEHNDTNQSSLKFLREGSVQSSPNGFLSSDAAPRSRQGTFELQLPADHYIDDDNTSDNKPIDFLGLASDSKPRNDADLTLVSAEGLGRFSDNSSTSGLWTKNNHERQQVTDLNESNAGIFMGRANGSVSRGFSHTLENSWHQPVLRPNTTNFSFNKEYSEDKNANEGISSNFDASARIRHDKPSNDKGKQVSSITFLAPRCSDADPSKYFKAANGSPGSYNQFVYQGENSSVGWFARSPLEPSAISNFATLDRPHHSNMGTFAVPVSIPQIDYPSIVSPMGSCTADPRSSVINNPDLIARFNGSSAVNSYTNLSAVTQTIGTSTPKLKYVDNLDGRYPGFPLDPFFVSHSRHEVAVSSYLKQKNSQKFEHSDRQSHGKGMKNFNLNEALSDCQEDSLVEQEGRCAGSFQHGKDGGSVFGISWLKNKGTCADPIALDKPRKLFGHSFGTAVELKNTKDQNEPGQTIRNLSDSASTSLGCGKNDGPSEDILARTLFVCSKAQETAARLPLSCQKHVPKDGQAAEGVIKKSAAANRNFIDLNDDVPNEDNSEESVVSHECQVPPLQNNQRKRAFVIDLEVPACEDGVAWTFDQECAHPGKLDVYQEIDNTSVTTAMAAAENIVALSRDIVTVAEVSDDLLQWFADLAISNIGNLAEQVELQASTNDSSDDELDSFESLTLKLEETRIDEYWSRPLEPAITTDEQAVSTAHLLTKPRRGQQRRRRQKRDFQKDILPGLSSLSRPEIIEDVQLLEGLVQTSGGSWESSLTRRGRYGGRTRGRKPRKTVVTVIVEEEVEVSPPPPKPAGTGDLEADERGMNMMGWGRTTRRCRRTRCMSGNNMAAAS